MSEPEEGEGRDGGEGREGGKAYHVPVMVEEVLRYLEPERGGLFFDGTVGGGGHAEAILKSSEQTRLRGADRDPEALMKARERLAPYGDRVTLEEGGYAEAAESLGTPLAGALLDLGVSSHQIDRDQRGFSFRPGTPLDMRMDPSAGGRTAADVLNGDSEEEIARIFYEYGEERRSRRLARDIVRRRAERPYETSDDLMASISRTLGHTEPQDRARLFQAVRIAVNAELEQLSRALPELEERLQPGGVVVVLAYHSLEDRIVKNLFREWSRECICPPELPVCRCRGRTLGEVLTRRPVRPTAAEVARNPRSRSALLRAWRKAA